MSIEVHIDWQGATHLVGRLHAAFAAAPRFGLKATAAKSIVREVYSAVADWRKTGKKLRIPARTLDAYASAFEHRLMDQARNLS
jgi:hypothetical protein